MGRKGKIEELGLVELVAEKWDGGKKTIVYVTEEINEYLEANNLKIVVNRESIRRVIRNHEQSVALAKQSLDAAKKMAEVLKDYPATELSEATLLQLAQLITEDIRSVDSISFDNPSEMIDAFTKVTNSQIKLSSYRRKAINALEEAKEKIKKELKNAIDSDPELLERLCAIVDAIEVK